MDPATVQHRLSGQRRCALEYRPSSLDIMLPATGPVLLLAHQKPNGEVTLFVDPEWRQFVQDIDSQEVGVLLNDFVLRAESEPVPLMKQLAQLHSGCLVTAITEDDVAADASLALLEPRFSRLHPTTKG